MANEYLQRTPTSTGNRKVFTWSGWVKKQQDAYEMLSFSGPSTVNDGLVMFGWNPGTGLYLNFYQSSTSRVYEVDEEYRDFGSWLHYQIVVDTTQTTDDDRVNFYINGVQRTLTIASGYSAIPQNYLCDNMTAGNETLLGVGRNSSGNLTGYSKLELSDIFFVDGQALTPDVFGFYKEGKGYISAGSTQATDFRPGQWVPKTPRVIKAQIERNGGFGVNGFYLPMNDSKNFGADFHCEPNSIITLKGEDLPQPRNGAPTTSDAYVSQLRTDPYAANLVLAVPGVVGGQGSGYGDYSANIKGSGSNKTLTANGNAGVAATASYYGSALSFDGSGDYLSIANNSDFGFGTGNFTIEYWINHNAASSSAHIFDLRSASDEDSVTAFYTSSTQLRVYLNAVDKITVTGELKQNQWTHHAIVRNGSTLTFYQNGVAAGINTTSGDTLRSSAPAIIGAKRDATSSLNGYLQDLRIYKGVSKYTGGFDVPRPYTPVGIATWRAVPDTTANNFATLNPLSKGSSSTLSGGNLSYESTGAVSTTNSASSNFGVSTGKYYWEVCSTSVTQDNGVGIAKSAPTGNGFDPSIIMLYLADGALFALGSSSAYGSGFSQFDICNIALDVDAGKIWFGKNGVYFGSGNPVTGVNPSYSSGIFGNTWFADVGHGGASGVTRTCSLNFGQNPTFSGNTTAGTFTDSNGKGLFKYQPPSDFLALCEDNLPTPAISNPGEYFKTVLYTGDGNSGRSITGIGFTPDLVWIKSRSATGAHQLMDSVRGAGIQLYSNLTNAESAGLFQSSFDSDGFSINYNSSGATNASGTTYTAWCWRAGAGTTSTNTDGSITSVVSVNQDAGFSIVSWTATGSVTTVGHGLGKKPKLVINKPRTGTYDWAVITDILNGTQQYLYLNSTQAINNTGWGTNPTDSVMSAYSYSNGLSMISYCWAEIEGFSKFGSYVGNGNADGPFVYCGFKPAFVLVKNVSDIRDWGIVDNSRGSSNPNNYQLKANTSDIETTDGTFAVDFLSNGFKVRNNTSIWNGSGNTMIFAAFAESPFAYSNSK